MRFRFTIRDLLWLTALIAVLVGWWIDRSRLSNRLGSDEQLIRSLKIAVQDYTEMYDESTYKRVAEENLELKEKLRTISSSQVGQPAPAKQP